VRILDKYLIPCTLLVSEGESPSVIVPFYGVIQASSADLGAPVRKPSRGAILFALIPFVAICFSVPLWDRIDPVILGLPFNFFWLIAWLLLTPLCMWGAYRKEAQCASDPRREDGGTP